MGNHKAVIIRGYIKTLINKQWQKEELDNMQRIRSRSERSERNGTFSNVLGVSGLLCEGCKLHKVPFGF